MKNEGFRALKRPNKHDEDYQSSDQDHEKTSQEREKAKKDKEWREKIERLKPIDPDLQYELYNNRVIEQGSKSSMMPDLMSRDKIDFKHNDGMNTERTM